jgi:hypothetical protein
MVSCKECNFQLGNEIETVNANTLWMEGRILIDPSKCSIIKDGKECIEKVVKLLKSKLAKKITEDEIKAEEKFKQK